MKRTLCAVLALILIGAVALAAAPKLSPGLFDSAKQALVALGAGDYDTLADGLPFSDAARWQRLAEGYTSLEDVQTDYAVAFWTGDIWVIAVPLQPPTDGAVEVLAFSSADGDSFNACRSALWSQVESACSDSGRVIWDKEYVGGSATVVADQGAEE